MTEIWKPIEGYDGLYEVSNFGSVKSKWYSKEIILKPFNDSKGYLSVKLYKNGAKKTIKVHKLVALAFVENPFNLEEVNHIDENKINNTSNNLEWVSPNQNSNHGTRNIRISKTLTGQRLKPIIQLDNTGGVLKEYKSLGDASIQTGIHISTISNVCHGKILKAGGFGWRYKND